MSDTPEKKSPLKEITQPFVDLINAPRALWGINLAYFIEGTVYFGMLNYLHMYFNEYVNLDDVWANRMVGVLTAGITIAMFFLGFVADKKGVRFAIVTAFCLMLAGRLVVAAGPAVGLEAGDPSQVPVVVQAEAPPAAESTTEPALPAVQPLQDEGVDAASPPVAAEMAPESESDATQAASRPADANVGMGSTLHIVAMLGILVIVVGYGMYQPGAYAAVRQFTTEKTAAMGFAMLYAIMNLGIVVTAGFGPIRNAIGIKGAYWVFVGLTVVALLCTVLILSRRTVEKAIADAKAEREREKKAKAEKASEEDRKVPTETSAIGEPAEPAPQGFVENLVDWVANHPLTNLKFSFFIFCLIPVQTLFAHQWLTMPMYVERAYAENYPWISKYFELSLALNPLLVFIFVPIVTALTQKRKVYNMMIIGTFVMAAPTFLLTLGPSPATLFAYIVLMTLGESMWQPRFLQYAAEIAPEGRTGVYMGVAQLPWFLTKMIVPLYAGVFLARYCPKEGAISTEPMWLVYALIAISSTVMLIFAKGWIGKDFKTKHS
jgi:MFS family permease